MCIVCIAHLITVVVWINCQDSVVSVNTYLSFLKYSTAAQNAERQDHTGIEPTVFYAGVNGTLLYPSVDVALNQKLSQENKPIAFIKITDAQKKLMIVT